MGNLPEVVEMPSGKEDRLQLAGCCSRSSLFGRWHHVHWKEGSDLGVTGAAKSLPTLAKIFLGVDVGGVASGRFPVASGPHRQWPVASGQLPEVRSQRPLIIARGWNLAAQATDSQACFGTSNEQRATDTDNWQLATGLWQLATGHGQLA